MQYGEENISLALKENEESESGVLAQYGGEMKISGAVKAERLA